MYVTSVFTYQIYARKKDVKNQANCAAKPLMQSAPKMKQNTSNNALKVALNVERLKDLSLNKPLTSLESCKTL